MPEFGRHMMSFEPVTDFTSVDSNSDPQFFVRFLEAANRLPIIWTSQQIALDGLQLQTARECSIWVQPQ